MSSFQTPAIQGNDFSIFGKELSQDEINNIKSIEEKDTQVREILKTIYDPDISVNILDLGIIYDIIIEDFCISIIMTLTSPTCPVADLFPAVIKSKMESVFDKYVVNVDLVFDPPWSQDMMSEDAKLQLDMFF